MRAARIVFPDGGGEMFNVEAGDSLADVEKRLIEETLQYCRTRDEAARMLGISTKTLYNKLRVYGAGPATQSVPSFMTQAPAGALDDRQRH